ncbi:phytanoyl-CoA dioxygenase family protein [Methyloceanibacter caenitepidi]|uniref:Phytanoyl-CoA dioxygenase family protein n=1 Tax=Methyloceanibacter caenitepidi TaxID=1384459 RepID=A0A0A8K061_9HYPH|nr:phytanoyl-CoA dioxygenase family protein [Methyloceanibacter caenitepidi]BAQ16310.1 phytanoyl-CoA dioxygenase family protein [Methyloceanibacter caenitepidi]
MSHHITRAVTQDEIAAYKQAGVVLLKGILSLASVNSLRRSIDLTVNKLDDSPSGYDFTKILKATADNDFDQLRAMSDGQYDLEAIMDYVKSTGKPLLADEGSEARQGAYFIDTGVAARLDSYRQLCTHGALPEIAGQLLQSGTVRFFGDQVFVKEPNTPGKTAFHQDATYFEIEGEQCCVMWVPADPVTLETGAMMYVRGSHRDGTLYKPNVFISQAPLPGSEGADLPDIENNLDDYDIVHFDVEPGDVLVHHYRTIHGTGGNQSRYQVRRAASIRYCGDDIRFKERPWAPAQLHHTSRLKTGDPLSGPDFPIVWESSPGDPMVMDAGAGTAADQLAGTHAA